MQELHNWQDDEGISMSKALFATPDACRSKDERQMLFNGSSSRCLRAIWSFVWSIWTADMTKQGKRGPGQCLKVCFNTGEQPLKVAPLMIMGDDAARDAPEPFNPMGIRIIGGRVDQVELLLQLSQHAAYEQGTCRRVDLEIISYHDGDSPATLRAGSGGAHLFAEHIGGAPWSNPAIEPAITPIYQTKAVDLAVVPRSLDQPLPTTLFEAPDPREGGMKGKLDLILSIEVGLWQQGQQSRKISGKLIPQIGLDKLFDG